jgi:hypothetical protein
MAKKRTGLQSQIAGIFSGVPVPKRSGQRSGSGGPTGKPAGPASKTGSNAMPKPATSKPIAPAPPMPQKPAERVAPAPRPKVTEIKAPEQKRRPGPPKISRRRKAKLFAPKGGVSSARQKAGIVSFILLSTVLVVVLARPYLASRKNPSAGRTAGTTDTGNPTAARIEIDWPMPPVYSADLRDPMTLRPPKKEPIKTVNDLRVRGIVVSEDLKQAIIGTLYVEEGDIVSGTKIRVRKINPNSVEFEENGKTWTQEVEGERK